MNPGEILDGRYEIVARLGAGGMGEVYKATHTLLNATRVIKVIHPHIVGNTDAIDRFLREARLATKVQHPNVATLHDFASLPDGSSYMVWEFIDGENLAQRLRTRGTLPPRQAVRIAIQSLNGLEAIHRAGIVHRDISPENLMITADDTVKIIDLGVAKFEDANAVSQTRTGIFVGKLRYAAPEQLGFLPEGQKIDGRADLYALAMCIVELLTGRPPYEAKSPHEYFMHHAREIPLTTVSLPPDLPGSSALQQILQKALSRNRDERYATAGDFAFALAEIEKTLPDPKTMATMATPLDGDATWRPSDAFNTTLPTGAPNPAYAAAQSEPTLRTPMPLASTEPSLSSPANISPSILPPLTPGSPDLAAPQMRKGLHPIAILAALFLFVVVFAAGAYALWPSISAVLPFASKPKPAEVASQPTAPRSEASIAVTPATSEPPAPVVTTIAPVTATTASVAPPPVSLPPAVKPEPQHHAEPHQDAPQPRPTSHHPSYYVDGVGRHSGNEQAIENLRQQLRGVHSVSLLAGGQQVHVYRALHHYIPNLEFDAESNVVIKFDGTRDRLRAENSDLSAMATIEKDGRIIFRYDLPGYENPDVAADAFAQTIADAFE
jgi:serine/threonine protein kinase